MDVRCERCSTDYEFDDALVSGRGTTVKCTNCGHKFKIRRSDGDFSEDFWNIQTLDGKTLVFTSLRELQRAIQSHLVEKVDLLSRGGLKQKPIGQIPELLPFFEARDAPRETRDLRDALKSAPPQPPPPPPGPSGHARPPLTPPPPRERMSTRPDFLPPLSQTPSPVDAAEAPPIETPRVEPVAAIVSAPPEAPVSTPRQERPFNRTAPMVLEPILTVPPPTDREADPERHAREHQEPVVEALPAPAAMPSMPSMPAIEEDAGATAREDRAALLHTQPIAPPEVVIPKNTPPPIFSPAVEPAIAQAPRESVTHAPSIPGPPSSIGRRRGVGGYIIAVIVLAGVAILGIVYVKDHAQPAKPAPTASAASADPHVADLLVAGEKGLTEGDYPGAADSIHGAAAIAPKDPRVLVDLARLAAVDADTSWLQRRLFPQDRSDEEGLLRGAVAARTTAEAAFAAAPNDPSAILAELDARRLSGETNGARELVPKIATTTSPATTYVLAALDLADPSPLWSSAIARLRVAANAETGPGRARAALIYALVSSGDTAGAKAEYDRLAAMPRHHPLLDKLRERVEGSDDAADAGVPDKGAHPKKGDKADKDKADKSDKADKGKLPTDPRQLVQLAETARSKGDYDKAQSLFSAALDRSPNDTEALAGLAAVAHARHDLSGAEASYKRVLSLNPSYVPALVGLGDCEYESGDKAAAMKTYKDIIDRFPPGTYPLRVRQRAGESSIPSPSGTSTSDPGGGG